MASAGVVVVESTGEASSEMTVDDVVVSIGLSEVVDVTDEIS